MPDRTVTLPTSDYGPVTLPEPSWCIGHEDQAPGQRADILHTGPERTATFRGHQLAAAGLVQSPYALLPSGRLIGVSVQHTGLGLTLAPGGVDQLAAVLVEHAVQLRALARQLTVLRQVGQ
ncbi:hypothetical protein OG292_22480 [Streptomyces sp. NBC_01511]|uniref:DUF6907 domain-containing protein n=1 Tax=Streptomyces sp. NBC_01511 TaxID=2903889 RepID=UPI00386C873C